MSEAAMQLRDIASVLRKGFAGHLAFDSAECQGMAKSLATAADELDRAQHILDALRKPSGRIVSAAQFYLPFETSLWSVGQALDAAVAAAEQEVERE